MRRPGPLPIDRRRTLDHITRRRPDVRGQPGQQESQEPSWLTVTIHQPSELGISRNRPWQISMIPMWPETRNRMQPVISGAHTSRSTWPALRLDKNASTRLIANANVPQNRTNAATHPDGRLVRPPLPGAGDQRAVVADLPRRVELLYQSHISAGGEPESTDQERPVDGGQRRAPVLRQQRTEGEQGATEEEGDARKIVTSAQSDSKGGPRDDPLGDAVVDHLDEASLAGGPGFPDGGRAVRLCHCRRLTNYRRPPVRWARASDGNSNASRRLTHPSSGRPEPLASPGSAQAPEWWGQPARPRLAGISLSPA